VLLQRPTGPVTMSDTALILFAHGARDPRWAEPFEAIRQSVLAGAPQRRVELAYLEFMHPTLPELADRLHAEGIRQAILVPLFLATGGHLRRDLPQMVAQIADSHPGFSIRMQPPIGESPEMQAAIVRWLAAL